MFQFEAWGQASLWCWVTLLPSQGGRQRSKQSSPGLPWQYGRREIKELVTCSITKQLLMVPCSTACEAVDGGIGHDQKDQHKHCPVRVEEHSSESYETFGTLLVQSALRA